VSANSVTLTANGRPHYLERTLNALGRVKGISQWQLYIGLEPGCDACARLCRDIDFMPVNILYNETKLGIRANPFNILKYAFDQGSHVNIHIEDDIILSPDLADLAIWYKQTIEKDKLFDVRVFFMGLFVTSILPEPPDLLTVCDFFSPWGLVINRYQWEHHIEPYWWNDVHSYLGRKDWTLSLSERLNLEKGLVILSPLLSRSANIGREQGVHSYPERFDLMTKGLVMNHKTGPFKYQITNQAKVPFRKLDYTSMTVNDSYGR
jgi:hypothetical protein